MMINTIVIVIALICAYANAQIPPAPPLPFVTANMERLYATSNCSGPYVDKYVASDCSAQSDTTSRMTTTCNSNNMIYSQYNDKYCTGNITSTTEHNIGTCQNGAKYYCNVPIVKPHSDVLRVNIFQTNDCFSVNQFLYIRKGVCTLVAVDGGIYTYGNANCTNGQFTASFYSDSQCTIVDPNRNQINHTENSCFQYQATPATSPVWITGECSDATSIVVSISAIIISIIAVFFAF